MAKKLVLVRKYHFGDFHLKEPSPGCLYDAYFYSEADYDAAMIDACEEKHKLRQCVQALSAALRDAFNVSPGWYERAHALLGYESETPVLQTFRFARYRNGREMAEGASTKAASLEEALAKVKSWYPASDTFSLETASKLNDFPTPTADMNAKGFVDPRPDFKTDGECKEHLWRLDSVTLQHRCVKCNAQKISGKP